MSNLRGACTSWRAAWIAAIFLLGGILLGGCAVQTGKSQAFENTGRLETDLRRGISTKADVLSILGEPDGSGEFGGFHAVRGPEHAMKGPADVWYYEDSRATRAAGMTENIRVLLVFFVDELFDGFYWFTVKASGDIG